MPTVTLVVVNCRHANAAPAESVRCRLGLFGGRPSDGKCRRSCDRREPRDAAAAIVAYSEGEPSDAPAPVPRADWPAWAAWLADRATPADRGVGDTLERLLGAGGLAFKTTWAATFGRLGIDCGCAARRARWNAMYRY